MIDRLHDAGHLSSAQDPGLWCTLDSARPKPSDKEFTIVFDRNLKTVDYSPEILSMLVKPVKTKNALLGKDLTFFAPDIDEIGALEKFQDLASNGGAFSLDCYENVTTLIRCPTYVKINIYTYNNLIYTVHTDITEQVQRNPMLLSLSESIHRLENYCAGLKAMLNTQKMCASSDHTAREQSNFFSYIVQTVPPMFDILSNTNLNKRQLAVLNLIANTLDSVPDSFIQVIGSRGDFTRREIQIADLIRKGKTTKEIADMLVLSTRTVDFHRGNIRRKLGINNSGSSLQQYLLAMGRK